MRSASPMRKRGRAGRAAIGHEADAGFGRDAVGQQRVGGQRPVHRRRDRGSDRASGWRGPCRLRRARRAAASPSPGRGRPGGRRWRRVPRPRGACATCRRPKRWSGRTDPLARRRSPPAATGALPCSEVPQRAAAAGRGQQGGQHRCRQAGRLEQWFGEGRPSGLLEDPRRSTSLSPRPSSAVRAPAARAHPARPAAAPTSAPPVAVRSPGVPSPSVAQGARRGTCAVPARRDASGAVRAVRR